MKFDFPLESCSGEERADLYELPAVHADDMLTLAAAPAAAVHDTPTPRLAAPAGLTWEERELSKRRPWKCAPSSRSRRRASL